jgi:hemerythrin-like domain-containing protein
MTRPALSCIAGLLAAACLAAAHAGPVEDGVAEVQHDWEVTRYQTPASEREKRYEALAAKARQLSEAHPGRSEPLVWEGIVVSSLAGEKGGLGALGLVKQARALYEKALEIRPDALDGSAYNSLGVLYYKVPGWPIGFGDRKRADEMLRAALEINPKGIDPNFFYGEFMLEQQKPAEAVTYLERAPQAPARPGRQIADAGRRDDARADREGARAARQVAPVEDHPGLAGDDVRPCRLDIGHPGKSRGALCRLIQIEPPPAPLPRLDRPPIRFKGEQRMADSIAMWRAEHANFSCLLDMLQEQLAVFFDGDDPDYGLMLDIVSYLHDYPDRVHHPHEDAVFRRMLQRDPALRLPINRLLQEHRVIAVAGDELRSHLVDIVAGAVVLRSSVEATAATYLAYYRHHLATEEREIVPRAAHLLGPGDWHEVARAVPHASDPLFGNPPEERYLALRERIDASRGARRGAASRAG